MTAARASGAPHAAPYSLEINGFRGICVLLVFLHHVANSRLPPPPDAASFWQVGLMNLFLSFGYGVELFFMISGYVIVNSLRRHATVSGFLYDRVLRIFPVWLPIGIVLCIGAALAGRSGFVDGFSSTWVVHSAVNLALLAPLVSLPMVHPASWSLTYEWIFYLASALAALAWRRPALEPRPALRLAWVLWALAVALLIACFPRGLFFLPGVLVALWPDRLRPLQRWPVLAVAALPVFLLTWLSTGIFAAEYGLPLWAVVANGHGPAVLVALAAGTLVFACVATPNAQGLGVLRSRAMQHLGIISYSFYLVHPVVMAVVKQGVVRWLPEAYGNWPATIVFALVSAALAWPLSHLSWQWGEQRLARWLRSLRSVNDAQARQQPLNHRGA